ncbi:MAG TPA: hypothetical protein PLH94_12230 [Fimbriimonadaceae bacterium]|nr:hypothetical protein [Fimbriimonadaceae bacterium]
MKLFTVLVFASLVISAFAQRDARTTDLKDGFVRVETSSYTIEVPKGWEVGAETSFGQRKVSPEKGAAEIGVMTAPPTRNSWDELYRTSLYFILREEDGNPTPYKLTKTAQGYEAASFSVLDDKGFAKRRYMLLKSKDNRLLALSIKIPGKQDEKTLAPAFDRLVRTARMN